MAQIVLDKSFLDGAKPGQIKSLCDDHSVLMPDVLFYELITTDENSRKRCFNKFPDTNNPVELIPNIGTLLRFELSTLNPCSPIYDRRENVVFNFHDGLRAGTFQFTNEQIETVNNYEEMVKLDTKTFFDLAMTIHVFFPFLNGIPYSEFPEAIKKAKRQAASDNKIICEIFEKFLEHDPLLGVIKPEALDPSWAYFRWIQVRVIYSLSLLLRYQGKLPENPSNRFWRGIEHDMVDAEYVVLAALAGSLASNDNTLIENYQLVCPDGLLFALDQ